MLSAVFLQFSAVFAALLIVSVYTVSFSVMGIFFNFRLLTGKKNNTNNRKNPHKK
jgi:hypothetical protein